MAKLYFLPRVALKAQDALLPLAWRLEAAVVRWTFRHLRRLPLEDAQARAARWFRRIGPRTPVAQKLLRNLAILHPEAPLSALKVEARDSFAALGQAVAELAHSDAISENPERFCEFTVDPAAEVALSDPQAPAVLITAHVGPWSFTNLIAAWGRFPLSILYAPQTNPAARGRAQGATRAHEELTVEARMGRMDHAHATTIKKLPHQGLMGTLENLSDGPLGLAIPARARNAHEHLVSVHGGA